MRRARRSSNFCARVLALAGAMVAAVALAAASAPGGDVFNGHRVVLDGKGELLPWSVPAERAYDHFLRLRWDFIKTRVPNCPGPGPRSNYPQYFFYCAYWDRNGRLEPDTWMNDVGEKIPNWFESARLYYAYTGDSSVMAIVKNFIDYAVGHGTSPGSFAWPNFPYTTTNAGDLEFRGFTSGGRLVLHEVQVDHAGEMGLTYYRLYLYTQDKKYLDAAIKVAGTLAGKARTGDAAHSVWPYRVVMDTGRITAEYGANWTGCYLLLDSLARAGLGNVKAYEAARDKAREFILRHPMQTGYWTDGHSDTDVNSNTYKSNLSASNAVLCLFDEPGFDPEWKHDVPKLIKWTEDNFVFRSAPDEPSTQWGANIVGEQDDFLFKMDYQTARYGAECARWYALSGDEAYKNKAYRSLNWVTYCNNEAGQAYESPLSMKKPISNWWSDCYGECPRMFYHAFAAVPDWAPPREDHILYSTSVIREVSYGTKRVEYTAAGSAGTDYLRLSFLPKGIAAGNASIVEQAGCRSGCYSVKPLGRGDYAVTIRRARAARVLIR